jgi:copper chaperone CopZ
MEGVEILELELDKKPFKVKYDPKKTELAKILAALKECGESAKQMD